MCLSNFRLYLQYFLLPEIRRVNPLKIFILAMRLFTMPNFRLAGFSWLLQKAVFLNIFLLKCDYATLEFMNCKCEQKCQNANAKYQRLENPCSQQLTLQWSIRWILKCCELKLMQQSNLKMVNKFVQFFTK